MDSFTASKTAANNNIPAPNSDVQTLLSKFEAAGLDLNDMVTLSGKEMLAQTKIGSYSLLGR